MKNSNSCEPRKQSCANALRRKDEELEQSYQANQDLREGLKQAISAIGSQQERVNVLEGLIDALQERIKTLERQQAKDSHNSSLPPSSDRFVRPPKSLRTKSGKKPGGQKGHRGHHLRQVETPDEVLIHPVDLLRAVPPRSAHPTSSPARATAGDRPADQTALGHRTSGGRKAVPQVLSSDTSQSFPACGEGPGPVWDEHPDAGDLSGGRPSGALRSRQSTVTGTARDPALRRQHRQLCEKLSPAVGRSRKRAQSGSGEGERDPPG